MVQKIFKNFILSLYLSLTSRARWSYCKLRIQIFSLSIYDTGAKNAGHGSKGKLRSSVTNSTNREDLQLRGSFFEGPEKFSHPKTVKAHSGVFFIREVSGLYSSLLLDTEELEMALRARKVSGLSRNGPQLQQFVRRSEKPYPKSVRRS